MNLEMPSITRYQLHIRILIIVLCLPLDLGLLGSIGPDGGYINGGHVDIMDSREWMNQFDEGVKESGHPTLKVCVCVFRQLN